MHPLDNLLFNISKRQNLPSVIYHYTNVQGLLGIINSMEMWATDILFLNDAAEYKYAKNLIHKKFRDLFKFEKNANKFLYNFVNRSHIINEYQIFVCSFSEDGNLLSQWRGYCPQNNGFSIGFDFNKIMSHLKQNKSNEFFLAPCIYDDEYQNELFDALKKDTFENIIEILDDQINNKDNRSSDLFNEKYHNFTKLFLHLCSIIKHPAFAEEKEWRLFDISKRTEKNFINYRDGINTVIPFKKFNFSSTLIQCPIKEVYIGPNPNKKLAKDSLKNISTDKHLSFKILDSKIPYRAL